MCVKITGFCIFQPLLLLMKLPIGCYCGCNIGKDLMDGDGIVLLAPAAQVLHILLHVSLNYGRGNYIFFNKVVHYVLTQLKTILIYILMLEMQL